MITYSYNLEKEAYNAYIREIILECGETECKLFPLGHEYNNETKEFTSKRFLISNDDKLQDMDFEFIFNGLKNKSIRIKNVIFQIKSYGNNVGINNINLRFIHNNEIFEA